MNPAEFPQLWCVPVAGGPLSLFGCHINIVPGSEVALPREPLRELLLVPVSSLLCPFTDCLSFKYRASYPVFQNLPCLVGPVLPTS